ncbi:MAG: 2,3-diphosphoglycerate-dependent phosphoglycerate mutase [Bdellovibrionales bacterium]
MPTLVILRHGESVWNQENRFTGWVDVDLAEKGVQEARRSGQALKEQKLEFDVVYTSVLKRAIKTLHLVLEEMDRLWWPVQKTWRLNERHYGELQGLNKTEMAEKHGEDQVKIWRRSYDVPPPFLKPEDPRHPKHDPRYANVAPAELPAGESLKLTAQRFRPLWEGEIAPQLKAGKNVLIVAHGNSLRSLMQILEKMTPEEIMEVNMPTGIPLLYRLDTKLEIQDKKFLGDPETVKKAIESVAAQGKKKV